MNTLTGGRVLNQNSSNDSRDYPRIPKETHVTMHKLDNPFQLGEGQNVLAKNISLNGLCFLAEEQLEPQTLVTVKIELNGLGRHMKSVTSIIEDRGTKAPLSAIAEVVWSKPLDEGQYETGVKFVNIYEDELRALKRYLSSIIDAD